MIAFWITEALPHAITSFIPIALFPLLGVMVNILKKYQIRQPKVFFIQDTVEICKLYAHETVFTFLGSLIIASSIEQCNLHKRIALKILCHVKCSHRRLLESIYSKVHLTWFNFHFKVNFCIDVSHNVHFHVDAKFYCRSNDVSYL